MKIGFLSERLIKGFGVDLVIHNQANGLAMLGYEVTVYVQRYDDYFKDRLYKVVEIDSPLLFNPLKTEYTLFKRKIKFFRNEQNDVWIIHSFPFFVLSPFLKGKVVMHDAGTVSSQGMYLKKKLVFLYNKYTSRMLYFAFADRVIAISGFIRSSLPFYVKRKTEVIYLGADHYTKEYKENKILTNETMTRLKVKKEEFNLLYVGRLNHDEQPYKGVNDLVNIYKNVKKDYPQLNLIMTGYGNVEDKEKLERMGIKVLLNSSNDELMSLYSLTDLYVSCTKWEGFNLPMVEAQSFGKIPLLYKIGAHAEIVNQDIDAFLVNTSKEYEEKLREILESPSIVDKMKDNAIKNAQKFSWHNSVNDLDIFIKSIQNGK